MKSGTRLLTEKALKDKGVAVGNRQHDFVSLTEHGMVLDSGRIFATSLAWTSTQKYALVKRSSFGHLNFQFLIIEPYGNSAIGTVVFTGVLDLSVLSRLGS